MVILIFQPARDHRTRRGITKENVCTFIALTLSLVKMSVWHRLPWPCRFTMIFLFQIEIVDDESQEENDDYCFVCGGDGDLICCDTCPKVYHKECHDPPLRNIPRYCFIASVSGIVLGTVVQGTLWIA